MRGSKVLNSEGKKPKIIHWKMQMLSRHWHLSGHNLVAPEKNSFHTVMSHGIES